MLIAHLPLDLYTQCPGAFDCPLEVVHPVPEVLDPFTMVSQKCRDRRLAACRLDEFDRHRAERSKHRLDARFRLPPPIKRGDQQLEHGPNSHPERRKSRDPLIDIPDRNPYVIEIPEALAVLEHRPSTPPYRSVRVTPAAAHHTGEPASHYCTARGPAGSHDARVSSRGWQSRLRKFVW